MCHVALILSGPVCFFPSPSLILFFSLPAPSVWLSVSLHLFLPFPLSLSLPSDQGLCEQILSSGLQQTLHSHYHQTQLSLVHQKAIVIG